MFDVCRGTVTKYAGMDVPATSPMGNTSNHASAIPSAAKDVLETYMRARHRAHAWTTLDDVRDALEASGLVQVGLSRSTIRRFVKRCGFEWGDGRKGSRPGPRDTGEGRSGDDVSEFVAKMAELRSSGWTAVYTDESYCHHHHRGGYGWFSDTVPRSERKRVGKGKRVCIVGAGWRGGWVEGSVLVFDAQRSTGDYHGNFNKELYWKWFEEMLLPNLPSERCVIVMDSAPYHRAKRTEVSGLGRARKADVAAYLSAVGVDVDGSESVAQLRSMARAYVSECVRSRVEELAEAAGHMVLFQPKGHPELQPIEMVWAIAKNEVASLYRSPPGGTTYGMMKKNVEDALAGVNCSVWRRCVDHSSK